MHLNLWVILVWERFDCGSSASGWSGVVWRWRGESAQSDLSAAVESKDDRHAHQIERNLLSWRAVRAREPSMWDVVPLLLRAMTSRLRHLLLICGLALVTAAPSAEQPLAAEDVENGEPSTPRAAPTLHFQSFLTLSLTEFALWL